MGISLNRTVGYNDAKVKKIMCSVKMEPELIEELDKVAKAQKMSRSSLLREFAKNSKMFHDFLNSQRAKQQSDLLSRWIIEYSPPEIDSKMMRFLMSILRKAAEMKEVQEESNKGYINREQP